MLINWLKNLKHRSRRPRRRLRRPRVSANTEALEQRQMLTTTVFLDFGFAFPEAGLKTTVGNLRDVNNAADPDAGADLVGDEGLDVDDELKFQRLNYDFNDDGKFTAHDTVALFDAVLPIVKRAFEPFDVDVQVASSASLADAKETLHDNDGEADGEHDAYVFVATVTSPRFDGDSVGDRTNLFGLAAPTDLGTGSNDTDEVVLTFADNILGSVAGTKGTDAFNDKLAFRLAYTAAHEAAHTLGLSHTLTDASNQARLTQGDQIRQSSNTRETHNIFTRFDLRLHHAAGTNNNYEQLRDDGDIGLVDEDRDGFPDFAYITGTGAHDQITLMVDPDSLSGLVIDVVVEAFSDSVGGNLIAQESYQIDLALDAEFYIRVDASVGNDEIVIGPDINTRLKIFGGDGNDTLRGGGADDEIRGEAGNDVIEGRGGDDLLVGGGGNDTIRGGDGKDSLLGGDGSDKLFGGDGNDFLVGTAGADELDGEAGHDILVGNSGNDTLTGGSGTDILSGGPDDDELHKDADDKLRFPDGSDADAASPASAPAAGTDDSSAETADAMGALTAEQVAAIRSGLEQVVARANSVENPLPAGDETVGAIAGDTLSRGLVAAVNSYLDSTPKPTIEGLAEVLRNLSGSSADGDLNVTVDPNTVQAVADASGTRFDLHFQATRTAQTTLDNLGGAAQGVQGSADAAAKADTTSTVEFDFSFGVAADGEFFIRLPGSGLAVNTKIDEAGLDMPVSVGLLGAQTEDGWVYLDANSAIVVPDADADGRITLSELISAEIAVKPSGVLYVELPFHAQLGANVESGIVNIVREDLSQDDQNAVEIAGSEAVQQFAQLNSFSVLQWLSELGEKLELAATTAELASGLPFAENFKLGEAADFATAFKTQVLDLVVNEDGAPNFRTVQELIEKLAVGAGIGPSVLGLDYSPHTSELTFTINFDQTFQHQLPLSLDVDFPRIADLEIAGEARLNVTADVEAGLVFGLSLAPQTSSLTLNGATPLVQLNGGEGVAFNAAGDDLLVTLSDGSTFVVDFTDEQTVGEVISTIETASVDPATSAVRVHVAIEAENNRLVLTQDASVSGAGSFKVEAAAGSVAGAGLAILDESTSGVIEGAPLDGRSLLDRFFLRDASFEAGISASVENLNGTARLGVFDLTLGGPGADVSFAVTVAFGASDVQGGLDAVDFIPQVSGSAGANLPVQLAANVSGVTLPVETALAVNWTDITDPTTLSAGVNGDIDLMNALESVAIGHVIEGLKKVVEFLQKAQDTSVFQTKIPLLNRSLAGLLDTSDKLDALSRELEENPPATINEAISRINELLDSAATAVRFENAVLEFDLNYGFEKTHQLNPSFDLDDATAGVASEFVDLNASAPIEVTASGAATLGLGIDLSDPSAPQFFVKDTSGLNLDLLVESARIDIDATVGPLGVFVRSGSVNLDNGTPGQAANWSISLAPGDAQGRHDLSAVLTAVDTVLTSDIQGRLDATLPVFFPTEQTAQGEIRLAVADLGDVAGTTTLTTPDFQAAIASLDLSGMLDALIDGWDGVMRMLQDALDGKALGIKLPLIGDQLEKATTFLKDAREQVVRKLEAAQNLTTQSVQDILFETFGPGGLDWLADRTDDADTIVTPDDVLVATTFDSFGLADEIDFQFVLDPLSGKFTVNEPIDVDLGLDGLGLEIDGAVDLDVDFNLAVGFGLSRDDGFYFHAGDGAELTIDVEATLPDATATARLGFLELEVTDDSAAPTHFTGTFAVDLHDGGDGDDRLSMAEIAAASSLSQIVDTRLTAEADVNLHVKAGVSDQPVFPSIEADFQLDWGFAPTDGNLAGTINSVGFHDVKINLGEFVDNLVEPLLGRVRTALDPVMPVVDALNARIPVLSGLAGEKITLLDLAAQFGYVGKSTQAFIETVVNLKSSLPDFSGFIHMGDLLLDAQGVRDAANLGKLQPSASSTASGPSADEVTKIRDLEDESGFSIPILDDPGKAFGLLLGRDVVLITYDLPRLDFSFDYEKFFPVIGPLGVTLKGEVGAVADFAFGYDTRGLRQFRDGGYQDPGVLLNGFYVSDTASADGSGDDVAEVEFYGGLAAYAAVSVAVAEVGVGGGLEASLELNLHDTDGDGRLYWQEIVGQLEQGSLIDITGKLTAFLDAYVKIGVCPLCKTYEKDFAETELASFTWEPTVEEKPVLGEVDADGVLRLNMGARAGERLFGDTADGNEHFEITAGSGGETVVTFFAPGGETATQTFTGVTRIIGDGGEGNDHIVVHSAVTAEVELRGGIGDDTIVAGGGPATLLGGAGGDSLTGGGQSAVIDGGEGNDSITGSAQADVLRGGDGNDSVRGGGGPDQIDGGAGDDSLKGDAGSDTIVGGDGSDKLYGGGNADSLSGGRGNDLLEGGGGNDTLVGGLDDDTLTGGAGNDLLRGETGNDVLRGGADDDTLEGGSGSDALYGEAGLDALFASIGADFLDGGADADTLRGGSGADELRGGGGDDELYGDGGVDSLYGETGDDLLAGGNDHDQLFGGEGSDTLLGEAGNDSLYGGSGGDVLRGGVGSDLIEGNSGEDRIQYAVDLNDPTGVDDLSGGLHRDIIEILGTEQADDLRVEQIDAGTFRVERRDYDPATAAAGELTAAFQFTLPASALERDIEVLRVSGRGGDDVIRTIGTFNVNQLQLNGGDGNDRLEGSEGDDVLFGGAGNDTLLAGAGRDELHGGDHDDQLDGGADADALYGEAGNDTVNGGSGPDVLYGGAGHDRLEAGAGIFGDVMFGDDDTGTLAGNDTLIGGDGVDVMFGGGGNDRLEGRGLSDIMHGEDGNDTLIGGTGRDFLAGGADADKLFAAFDDATPETAAPTDDWQQVYEDLLQQEIALTAEIAAIESEIDQLEARIAELTAQDPNDPAITDLQAEVERLEQRRSDLSNERAVINLTQIDIDPYQSVQVDILVGQDGDDTLRGSAYNDRLIGGSGNDVIEHTAGIDVVFGGTDPLPAGGDTTDGADELDQYRIFGTDAADSISVQLDAGDGTSTPQAVVSVNGVAAQASHNGIEVVGVNAAGGNDTVTVELGHNGFWKVEVDGGAGHDRLDASSFQSDATIRGGAGNDSITGGAGADIIDGGSGVDRLVEDVNGHVTLVYQEVTVDPGFGIPPFTYVIGSYTVHTSAEDIVDNLGSIEEAELTGGDAHDTIDAGGFHGDATIRGGAGNDVLIGGFGDDLLDGEAGNDAITGGFGDDTLQGGDGTADRLVQQADVDLVLSATGLSGPGTDTFSGIERATLTGGDGNNRIDATTAAFAVTINGGAGNDTLYGSAFSDSLNGGAGNDQLYGRDGSDSLDGGTENDYLLGQNGNDVLLGRSGHDTLFGGNDADTLIGSTGADRLYGQDGNDVLYGDDIFFYYWSSQPGGDDYLDGGSGDDYLAGQDGNDYLYGNAGNDTLDGGTGNDTLSAGYGNDSLHGGNDNDRLYGTSGVNTIKGGSGNDSLYGGSSYDYVYGEDGDDYLSAGYGYTSNYMYGGNGKDRLYGSYGIDYMYGHAGDDYLYGGSGNDWLFGGYGDDTLSGGSGHDYLYGQYGNDLMYGGSGNDRMYGGNGYDTMRGSYGNDSLYGGNGRDFLYGGYHDDYLDGGNDATRDYLYGGYGADTFRNYYTQTWVYDPSLRAYILMYSYQDTIGDFNASQGDTQINVKL